MTFSTSKVGTIEEVKEHLRSHHVESETNSLLVDTHNKARKATIAEVEEFAKRGHTHVAMNMTGSTYVQENGQEGVGYQVGVAGFDETHYARVYQTPDAETK